MPLLDDYRLDNYILGAKKYLAGDELTDSEIEITSGKGNGMEVWSYVDLVTQNAYGIAVDYLGDVYTAHGALSNSINLRKFTSTGATIWGIIGVGLARRVAVDGTTARNIYVTHSVPNVGEKSFRKLTTNGAEIWAKTDHRNGYGVAVDLQNGDVVCTHNDVATGAAFTQTLRKYNSNGVELWGNNSYNYARDVAIDVQGNIYCTYDVNSGKNLIKFSSTGVEVWSQTIFVQARDVAIDAQGNVYCVYATNSPVARLAKFDSTGSLQWAKVDASDGYAVEVDVQGNIYCAYLGGVGAKGVVKYKNDGTEIWSKTDVKNATDVAVDSQGYVYSSHLNNSPEKVIRKIDGKSYYRIKQ